MHGSETPNRDPGPAEPDGWGGRSLARDGEISQSAQWRAAFERILMPSSRRPLVALAVISVAGALASGPVFASGGGGTSPLRFSHEVVVDNQRDGFEPDIQVGPGNVMYTSVPNGSSTTTSWLWTSTDQGNSFHLVPGNAVGTGRLFTCPQGGGDTEEALDGKGDLFFSDLQNLSNLSNSVSTNGGRTFLTTCSGADNTPVDRMWYAVHGNLGAPDFRIYEEYDAVLSSANIGNQLVLEASNNGVTFAPVVNPKTLQTAGCTGGGALNCTTGNEGISGNIVLAPNGDVLMAHTTSDSNQAVITRGHITGTYPNLSGTYTNTVVNRALCPDFPVDAAHMGKSEICGATNFVTVAEDSAGHAYACFASQRKTVENVGGSPTLVPSGPYEVYIAASPDGTHWHAPVQVSRTGSNAFAWVTAGSSGRVAVAWYSANETHERPVPQTGLNALEASQLNSPDPHGYLFDDLTHAEFSVDVGESLNALAPAAHYSVATVSEHPIKYGPICTQGLGCTLSGGDRSLGDFLEVNHDSRGALVLSYVDDTSGYYAASSSGQTADNGPSVVVRQIGGPSLFASVGEVRGPGAGPGTPMGSVTDRTGDAFYSANGTLTSAGSNLDLTAASMRRSPTGLVITMRAANMTTLMVNPQAGGSTGEWITRFTTYDPHTQGNGHIYYAGMESVAGGAPRFFAGEPTMASTDIVAFDSTTAVPGSYNSNSGTITIDVPFSVIGGHSRPGTEFYSVTAFTATSATSLAHLPASLFNVVDATAPYDFVLPRAVS